MDTITPVLSPDSPLMKAVSLLRPILLTPSIELMKTLATLQPFVYTLVTQLHRVLKFPTVQLLVVIRWVPRSTLQARAPLPLTKIIPFPDRLMVAPYTVTSCPAPLEFPRLRTKATTAPLLQSPHTRKLLDDGKLYTDCLQSRCVLSLVPTVLQLGPFSRVNTPPPQSLILGRPKGPMFSTQLETV